MVPQPPACEAQERTSRGPCAVPSTPMRRPPILEDTTRGLGWTDPSMPTGPSKITHEASYGCAWRAPCMGTRPPLQHLTGPYASPWAFVCNGSRGRVHLHGPPYATPHGVSCPSTRPRVQHLTGSDASRMRPHAYPYPPAYNARDARIGIPTVPRWDPGPARHVGGMLFSRATRHLATMGMWSDRP